MQKRWNPYLAGSLTEIDRRAASISPCIVPAFAYPPERPAAAIFLSGPA